MKSIGMLVLLAGCGSVVSSGPDEDVDVLAEADSSPEEGTIELDGGEEDAPVLDDGDGSEIEGAIDAEEVAVADTGEADAPPEVVEFTGPCLLEEGFEDRDPGWEGFQWVGTGHSGAHSLLLEADTPGVPTYGPLPFRTPGISPPVVYTVWVNLPPLTPEEAEGVTLAGGGLGHIGALGLRLHSEDGEVQVFWNATDLDTLATWPTEGWVRVDLQKTCLGELWWVRYYLQGLLVLEFTTRTDQPCGADADLGFTSTRSTTRMYVDDLCFRVAR